MKLPAASRWGIKNRNKPPYKPGGGDGKKIENFS